MTETVYLNGIPVSYELTRKNVKNINLRICADGCVRVSANRRVSKKYIESFIVSKADFVLNSLGKLKKSESIRPKAFSDTERFMCLGKETSLFYIIGEKKEPVLQDGSLYLYIDRDTPESRKKAFEKWERNTAISATRPFIEEAKRDFEKFGGQEVIITHRRMVSRWGSCQPEKSRISLNIYLAEVPVECARYVVYHEFVHLIEANHSKAFYDKLSLYIPDYAESRNVLRRYSAVGR